MHRPFMHYPKAGDDDSAENLQEVLKAHRNVRGFEMKAEDAHLRRPRTIFFTPDTRWEAQTADFCWVLPKKVGGECKSGDPHKAWPDTGVKAAPTAAPTTAPTPKPSEPLREAPAPSRPEVSTVTPPPPLPGSEPPRMGGSNAQEMNKAIHEQRSSGSPEPASAKQERYNSPSRQPGRLKEDRILPPSQSALLKQELLALGPRPLSTFKESMQRMNESPDSNFGQSPPPGSGPPVAPKPLSGASATPSWGSATPLLRPPGYEPREQIMEPTILERKADHSYNRRCCGPY